MKFVCACWYAFVPAAIVATLLLQVSPTSAQAPARAVAAVVGGKPLYVDEVVRAIQTTLGNRKLDPQSLISLQAQALNQLVDRRLVERYLATTEFAVTETEIDEALGGLKAKVAAQQIPWEEFLKKQTLTEEVLRGRLVWETTWRKYLAKQLNDESLQGHFAAHRQLYDGSEISASHILLRPVHSGDAKTMAELLAKAKQIRQMILAKEITFADAARRYSDGPSRKTGGELGYFPRHGVMMEPFARAAYELAIGEISDPVVTRFGVHLIKVLSVRPGNKQWTDVRQEMIEPLAKELFNNLAKAQRDRVEVVYTGKIPFIKPGTRDIIVSQPGKKP